MSLNRRGTFLQLQSIDMFLKHPNRGEVVLEANPPFEVRGDVQGWDQRLRMQNLHWARPISGDIRLVSICM